MLGRSEGIRILDQGIADALDNGALVDMLFLCNRKAQIKALDGENEAALEIFVEHIDPWLSEIPLSSRVILEHNRASVSLDLWHERSAEDFYRNVDLRRKISPDDSSSTLEAEDAASSGRHREALPLFWQDLQKAYRSGDWNAERLAHVRMAKQCLRLGWLQKSSYHAMIARDRDVMKMIAQAAIGSGSIEVISDLISGTLRDAHLLEHAATSSGLLRELWDVIPEDQLAAVVAWCLAICLRVPSNRFVTSAVGDGWKLMFPLTHRVNREQATVVVRGALKHPLFTTITNQRKLLIGCIGNCLPKVALGDVGDVARAVVGLLTTEQSDFDFEAALDLSKRCTQRSRAIRDYLARELFPIGSKISDPRIIAILPAFGKGFDSGEANKMGLAVSRQVKAQVRRSENPVAALPESSVGGFGTISWVAPGKQKVEVSIFSSGHELDTLSICRHLLTEETVSELLNSSLSMVSDPDNIAANKTMLIKFIETMGDQLSQMGVQAAVPIIAPLASGIMPAAVLEADVRARDVLNPFQFNLGTVEELRGAALCALAEFSKNGGLSASVERDFVAALQAGLAHPSSVVRCLSLRAACKTRTLAGKTLTEVLLKIWDPEPDVADWAISAICRMEDLQPDNYQWWMLAFGIRDALKKSNAELKRTAAASVGRLRKTASDIEQRAFATELGEWVSSDVHFSVRQQLLDPPKTH